jgi:hypothetical protein
MQSMKSKQSSARHIAPAPPADFVVFAPEGFMSVTSGSKTPCTLIWKTIEGDVNGLIELTAAPEFLEPVAFSLRPTVEIEIFELKFRVRKSGYDKVRRTLFLLASSFFHSLARALERRECWPRRIPKPQTIVQ